MAADFLIKLDVRHIDGRLSAVCDQVHGLHIRSDSPEALRQEAMRAVKALYRFNDKLDVEVSPTDDMTVLRIRPLS